MFPDDVCACDFYDYEAPDVYRKSYPRAKIQHICEECGEPILPGQKYEYVFGKWEGEVSTFKTHMACAAIRNKLCMSHGELAACGTVDALGFDWQTVPDWDGESDD